jgi:hypothetical protein
MSVRDLEAARRRRIARKIKKDEELAAEKILPIKTKKTTKTKPVQKRSEPYTGFQKGVSGNPKGRAKGSGYFDELMEAIRKVETRKKITLCEHFVEQAYKNPKVLAAVMNKLIANKQFVEIDGTIVPDIHIHYDDEIPVKDPA